MTKVAMTGGREYNDYEAVCSALNTVKEKYPDMVLIHGAARGADSLAHRWAVETSTKVIPFPADWNTLGKRAGIVRNELMANQGLKGLVAFPGGRGTQHMVDTCKALKIPIWAPYGGVKL